MALTFYFLPLGIPKHLERNQGTLQPQLSSQQKPAALPAKWVSQLVLQPSQDSWWLGPSGHHMEQKNRLAKLFLKCKMPCIAFSITLWAPHYTAEDNWDNRPRGYWWIWFGRVFPGTFPSSWETLLLLHLWMLPRLLVKKSEGKTKHQGPLSGRPCRTSLPPEWGWIGGWRTWATQWMIWMTGSEPLSHFREW